MILRWLKYVLLLLLGITLSISHLKAESKEQRTKVVLRSIGHEFLLQSGDSSTIILPIEKIGERYCLRFADEFPFEPSALTFASVKVMEDNFMQESYIVEAEKCSSNEIIHSFEASLNDKDNLMPCSGRELEKDCYVFYFTEVETQKEIDKPESKETSYLNYVSGLLILMTLASLLYFKNKRQSHEDPDLIHIGDYLFNKKNMTLTLKKKSIELSGKESDLLLLLCTHKNKTLKREYILSEIWGDGGDYIGRTLDVFISKLRKKLEGDVNIKIVNVRGVGYRFVIQ